LSTTNGRITVDTTAPTAGTLTMTSTDTGTSPTDGIINSTTPSFSLTASGTADTPYTGTSAPTAAISSVVLQVSSDAGTNWTDNATFTGSGPYTVTAAALTTNTTYSVRALVTDLAGKTVTTALSTTSGSLTIDSTAPTAGTLAVSETDGTSNDGVVKTATPVFTVTSPADTGYGSAAIVSVQLQVASGTGQTTGFADTGSAVTSATNSVYSLTTGTLAAGTYTIRAVTTDVAGNTSNTGSVNLAVDLTNPTAGTVAVTDTYGNSTTDAIVRSGTPAFTVTGASDTDTYTVPGIAAVASVQLQVASGSGQTTGFANTGSAVTSATGGVYTLAPTSLSDGTYTIRALVTDLAGNQSTTSGIDVFVDTTAPTAGTLAIVETNGTTGDGVVSTATPAFTVSGASDSGYSLPAAASVASVQLQVASGTSGGSFANSGTAVTSLTNGAYALTLGTQTDGTYRVQAVVTDLAGNTSTTSPVTIAVDLTAPTAGTLAVTDTYGTTTDSIVRTRTPAFTLTGASDSGYTSPAAAGVTSVRLQVASGTSGGTFADSGTAVTTANSDGTYTLTLASQADGTYRVQAIVTDLAGNTSTATAVTIYVDVTPTVPTILDLSTASDSAGTGTTGTTSDDRTNVQTPVVTGTSEAGSTVTLSGTINGVTTVLGTATASNTAVSGVAGGTGTWSITTTTLAEGVHSLTATSTDAAGNVSGASTALAITIDITTATPTLDLSVASDTAGTGTTGTTSDRLTSVTTPVI
ncbi:MAG: hypothetical protein EBZ89_10720, partial [Chloroflexi bacterium]|nr:hypothetical protein [Chloroflexota bacterium]